MAQNLLQAAEIGDIEFLNDNIGHGNAATDLLYSSVDDGGNNIIHISVRSNRDSFIRKALAVVPQLMWAKNKKGMNPFHLAAENGLLPILEILTACYRDAVAATRAEQQQQEIVTVQIDGHQRPWLEEDLQGVTPLHRAIKNGHEQVTLYLLDQSSLDHSLNQLGSMCGACDEDGYSPLYLAIQKGWDEAALKMLESPIILSEKPNYRNPLTVAPYCSEEVGKKLLKDHPKLIQKCNERNENFLHDWVDDQKQDALKWLLQDNDLNLSQNWPEVRKRIISHKNTFGNNPLHFAAQVGVVETAELLMNAYSSDEDEGIMNQPPWLQQNQYGNTPLLTALMYSKEEIALCLLKVDPASQCKIASYKKESPLFLAVRHNCIEVAKMILMSHATWNLHNPSLHTGPDEQNPLHVASNCPDIVDDLIQYCDEWVTRKDEYGNTPIDIAAERGCTQLLQRLMQCTRSDNTQKAWIKACEGGHLETLLVFISAQYGARGFLKLYEQQTDTPLHHIRLNNKRKYKAFLSKPEIETLKDKRDKDGATPLHRAIEREDKVLVEVLLSKSPDLNIRNKYGETALHMLARECKASQEWDLMCKQMGLNPRIRTTNVQPKTNLGEMRSTMSVVAALLATITFTAGIQVPGGYKDSSGYAVLVKKGAFIVFLISNTYAMCCSLLVLFCLIWAMGLDPDKSLVLIDLNVTILLTSLVGTLIAFMTGVFVVVSHDSLWLAIIVIVMCALVPFIAYRTILLKLLQKFIPTTR